MRWIFSISCALFLFCTGHLVHGEPVDRDLARQVAETQVSGIAAATEFGTMSIRDGTGVPLEDPDTGRVLGYVFVTHPVGYVVVAADTGIEPVVAFSTESDFSWNEAETNALLHVLRADLDLRMAALEAGVLPSGTLARNEAAWGQAVFAPAAALSETATGPLLQSATWSGGDPWNSLCPIDPTAGRRSAVGCVATATAQIIAYWGYPSSVAFGTEDDYVTATRGILVDAGSASISEISYGMEPWANPETGMMAALSYAVGVSIAMDYTASGSGAHVLDVAVALAGGDTPYTRFVRPGVWGYASAELRTYEYSFWGTPFYVDREAFYRDLAGNMDAGMPAELAVVSDSGGHAIICDGFDPETGMFHLNFGWGGTGDGWYSLPTEIPYSYNVITYGVMDIAPPSGPESPELLPATAPVPADGAADVSPSGPLGFSAGNANVSVTYDVYMGTDVSVVGERSPEAHLITLGPSEAGKITVELSQELAHSTQYFWVVDTTAGGECSSGALWGFRTAAEAVDPMPQPGGDITVEPSRLEIDAGGGTETVTVAAVTSWAATCSASWINIDAASGAGTGNGSFSYSVSPNTGSDERQAEIHVEQAIHIVVQSGATPVQVPSPTLSPEGGEYVDEVQVVMSCSVENAAIRFTLDGSDPSENSLPYTDPVVLVQSAVVKARAFPDPATDGWIASETSEAAYTVIAHVAAPAFDPPGGTYARSVEIALSCPTPGAEIRYTLDGAEPTPASARAIAGETILLENSSTVRAKAFLAGWAPSVTVTACYEITIPRHLQEDAEMGLG
ncbi:C10 family peptidase, partial [Candidatus Bipolaricaulota bacterium]|nr:C10 family peptidase [Candidatus Bipolaricaulota bacterium]